MKEMQRSLRLHIQTAERSSRRSVFNPFLKLFQWRCRPPWSQPRFPPAAPWRKVPKLRGYRLFGGVGWLPASPTATFEGRDCVVAEGAVQWVWSQLEAKGGGMGLAWRSRLAQAGSSALAHAAPKWQSRRFGKRSELRRKATALQGR